MSRKAEIVGWGCYAPEHVMTNDDLSEMVDTSDEWIRSRTGIAARHIVDEHQATAAMAIEAARRALQSGDINPLDIDLVIVATSTPDFKMPSTACLVQNDINATHAGAYDLNAGCSGFVYALTVGHQAIASGEHDLVMIIGADSMSRVVDWQDRNTCVLFGDGAGAVILQGTEGDTGVLATLLGSDGSGWDVLNIPAGGSRRPADESTVAEREHYLRMNGRQVFRFATHTLPQSISRVVAKAGLTIDDIDWIIPHQANLRIISTAARRLKIDQERFITNLDQYGNTSAASVPLALCQAIEEGKVQQGQHLVLVGFGAGLTWAATTLVWGVSPEPERVPFLHTWGRKILYGWARMRTRVVHAYDRATVWLIRMFHRDN